MSKTTLATRLQTAAAKAATVTGGKERAELTNGKISLAGREVPTLEVILLASVAERTYYPQAYTGEPVLPTCYSYDDAPARDAQAAQAVTCAECPHNQWGSDAQGRGKACKERIKIAFTTRDVGQIVVLRAPVTSTKNFGAYNSSLIAHGFKASLQCITSLEASTHPKWKNVTQLHYRVGEALPNPVVEKALDSFEAAYGLLTQPYEIAE